MLTYYTVKSSSFAKGSCMCFSATASFLVSGLLFFLGSRATQRIKKPNQTLFAYIPFLFAIQQACEGIIWITGSTPTLISIRATYLFLAIAFIIWPIWIPYSIMKLERNNDHRRILSWLTGIGCLISLFFLIILVTSGAHAKILNCHIYYHFFYQSPYLFDVGYLYVIPTVLPFFFSTVPRMKIIGTFVVLSVIASYILWHFFFTSIWCFFAALISSLILTIL
jgi:hypothetical protein